MRQGLTDAHVVEWLALVVECHDEARHPGTFEDDRVFLHLREHAVTLRRRNTPELDVELAAGKAGRQRGAFDEEGLEAVEMRVARPEVAVETLPLPALALHMADEREGTGAEHVRLREPRVFLELGSAVDAVPRRGEAIEHARVRGRQPEDDRVIVGSIDTGDVLIKRLPGREHARRWLDQPLIGRPHVSRCEQRPIVEFHALAELEREGAAVGCNLPTFRDIADDFGFLPVPRVLQQPGVMREDPLRDTIVRVSVAVVIWWLRRQGIVQDAALLGRL